MELKAPIPPIRRAVIGNEIMHEVPRELLCAELMAIIAYHSEPSLLSGVMY